MRVRLRRPTAPGDQLHRAEGADGAQLVRGRDELVAEARRGELLVDRRPAPAHEAIAEAMSRPLPHPLPFETCLGCGTAGHSLGMTIRPVPDDRWTVGSWTPRAELADEHDTVDPVWIWTVLDCVISWAIFNDRPADTSARAVTGTIAFEALRPIRAGETVTFWTWREFDDERRVVAGGGLSVGDEVVGWADQELIRTTQGMDLGMFA